jgi:hypothetical protein
LSEGLKDYFASGAYSFSDCKASLGCWKDTLDRSIAGNAQQLPQETVSKDCYNIAKEHGWSVYAVQNGEECFTAANAGETYQKHGTSSGCRDGIGGFWAMDVYKIIDCPKISKYFSPY